jgi:starch phosphorylase
VRILVDVDDEKMDWEPAWEIAEVTFGYTNHTLMPESREKWPLPLFGKRLPRHLQLIYEINRRFLRRVQTRWPTDLNRLSRISIIEESSPKQVRMAHPATVGSHSINGVADLHTQQLLTCLHIISHCLGLKTAGRSGRRVGRSGRPALRVGSDPCLMGR